MECWGAQGGDWGANTGGKGGYATGNINASAGQICFIYVGQSGKQNSRDAAANWDFGFNGGGKLKTSGGGSSGGGATHIATGTNDRGQLRNYSSNRDEIIIVAGAGGGASNWPSPVTLPGTTTTYPAGYTFIGGFGGGTTGGEAAGISSGISYVMHFYGGGQSGPVAGSSIVTGANGTNTEGGFGYGGFAVGGSHCAGSGGSGWYGGTGGYDDSAGGGGSSWISSSWLAGTGSTIAGNQNMIQPDGTYTTGHSGDGYAIITYVKP